MAKVSKNELRSKIAQSVEIDYEPGEGPAVDLDRRGNEKPAHVAHVMVDFAWKGGGWVVDDLNVTANRILKGGKLSEQRSRVWLWSWQNTFPDWLEAIIAENKPNTTITITESK